MFCRYKPKLSSQNLSSPQGYTVGLCLPRIRELHSKMDRESGMA